MRRVNEDQSWLAKGSLDVNYEWRDWFDRAFMELDSKRFSKIHVRHPGGEEISLVKAKPEDEHFVIQNLPAGRTAKSLFEADDYATTFAGFRVDDVVSAKNKEMPADKTIVADYDTFDGMHLTVRLFIDNGVHWTTFEASTAPGITASEGAKVDPVKDAQAINDHAKGWVFDVSDYRLSAIKKHLNDMLAEKQGS